MEQSNVLLDVIEDVLADEFEYFTPSEIEEEIALTRLRRISKEYSKFGGVRDF